VRAIEQGIVQQRIHESAYRHQKEIESGGRAIVGVNRYAVGGGTKIPIHRLDPALERDQVARLRRLRERRDASKASAALAMLEEAARGQDNLVPRILHSVESMATLGEIAAALRRVFGKHAE
jgi:methylmalonyl-CoA mutase N-terminal domain/subunit